MGKELTTDEVKRLPVGAQIVIVKNLCGRPEARIQASVVAFGKLKALRESDNNLMAIVNMPGIRFESDDEG